MGRGLRRNQARAGTVARTRHRVVIGRRAQSEFRADVLYIARESTKGATIVLEAVSKSIQQLRLFPERGRVDPGAVALAGSRARKLAAEGFVIRYLYPVRASATASVVLVLSVRRGERLPISDREFLLRYAQEQAGLR